MTGTPLVSVIMNCLNCERYLKEAIDSVYDQSYNNWEIIFWDNGSNDRSKEIAKLYDSKLKYFRSDKTTILGTARALAVEQAEGEYLAFLDCDDIWFKDKLQDQMQIFLEDGEDLGLVYGKCEVLYENSKERVSRRGSLPEGMIFANLAKENFIPFVSAVVKKDVFYSCGGFPSNIKHSTDYWLFLQIAISYRVRALQDPCCIYRFHLDNLSSKNPVLAAKESIQIVSLFLPNKAAEDGLKNHYVDLAIAYIRERSILKSLKTLFINGVVFRMLFRAISKIARLLKVK